MCWRRSMALCCVLWALRPGHAAMTERIIPPEEPIFTKWHSEPQEIRELTDVPSRVFAVHESWSGGCDTWHVHCRGDAAVLSRQLEAFESQHRMRDYTALVRINDGVPPDGDTLFPPPTWLSGASKEWWDQHGRTAVPEYDWRVSVSTQRALGGPDRGKLLKVSVYIEVWVSPRLPLDKLQVPPTLRVEAAGRVEQLARAHEAQRLGGEVPMLKERIRKLQEELLRVERRVAATQPATQPASR